MLRTSLCLLAVILYLIVFIPMLGILWLIGRKYPRFSDIVSLRMVQGIFKIILFLAGTRLTVIGRENIPEHEAVLYICNHNSIFDTVINYSLFPDVTGIVAKIEMARVPLLSIWMRRLHCLFLDRANLRQGVATINEATENVKAGISMCIFPEGTFSQGESELEMLPFHEGSFNVARRSGCKIVPIAITGSAEIFEKNYPHVKRRQVTVEYGEAIIPAELGKEERKRLGAYTREKIYEMLLDHKEYRSTGEIMAV